MKFFSFHHLFVIALTLFFLWMNESEIGVLIVTATYGVLLLSMALSVLMSQVKELEARLDKLDEIMKGLK